MCGLKRLHRLFQRSIGCQRPDEIFVVGDPCSQSRTEPALSQSMNEIRQPQLRMHQKFVSEVRVAGDVQFKRDSLDQLPVHDDAHTAIVSRRHDANQ